MIDTKCPKCSGLALSKTRKLFPIFLAIYCKSCGAELAPSSSVGWLGWIVAVVSISVFYFAKGSEYSFVGWLALLFAYLVWQARMRLKLLNFGRSM